MEQKFGFEEVKEKFISNYPHAYTTLKNKEKEHGVSDLLKETYDVNKDEGFKNADEMVHSFYKLFRDTHIVEDEKGIESKIKELISANKSDEEIIETILALDEDRETRLKELNKKSDKDISMDEAEEEIKLYKQKRKDKIDKKIDELEKLLDEEFYPAHIGHTDVFTTLYSLKRIISDNI
jgi:hypothetical protein